MKLLILVISFFISFQTLAAEASLNSLTFSEPTLILKKVVIRKALPKNLIRLYTRMPSDMRMVAGHKEVKSNMTL